MTIQAYTHEAEKIEDETAGVILEGIPDDLERQAIWLVLSLISGNRVNLLSTERYDDAGSLIDTTYEPGSGVSTNRKEPFGWHSELGRLSARGLHRLFDGVLRTLRSGFPIGVMIHHLTDANTDVIESDAQHLVLAIHTAIEAWNRAYGLLEWIDDDLWECFITKARRPLLSPIYETVGAEMKANLAAALRYANRTQTAWREERLFTALGIDVSDPDSKRVLLMRNELLHNGYFLLRWKDATPLERDERLKDVRRLRNLAYAIIFRLTAYEGDFFDFLTYSAGHIRPVPLPRDIAPPDQAEEIDTGAG